MERRILWEDLNAVQIFADIVYKVGLADGSERLGFDTPLVVAAVPKAFAYLGAATEANISVLDMLRRMFANVEVKALPAPRAADAKIVDGAITIGNEKTLYFVL